ncbi:hypothetical protein ACFWBN_36040 [Streptomyces sp. NPDC059989]|uniref:hypothetical protein n=1 Tax=Streptomyces sp. NPDC059989 TaxID=3347026 RepID=UPI0036AEB9B8
MFKQGVGGMAQARGTTQLPKWPGHTGMEWPDPAARPRNRWWAAAPGAEAIAGAELLLGMVLSLIWPEWSDNYGRGGWGPFAIILLMLLCVVALFVLPGLAFLHALVFTRPALDLARKTGNAGVAPAYLLAVSAACAVFPWALGAPYAGSLVWIAASAMVPLLVAWRARRRGTRPGVIVAVTAWATGLLLPVTVVGGVMLVDRGVLTGYEPPRLERAAYVGEWRSASGGVVRLREGGQVEVEELLVEHADRTVTRCTAAGTWTERSESYGLRAGVDLEVSGCAGWEVNWEVAGTVEHPELFHLIGDPDRGDMQLLRRA